MIPTNTFDTVFNIRVNSSSSGSCFTMLKDGKHYLVTAKHVLGNLQNQQIVIQIETNKGWEPINYSSIQTNDNPEVDIAAIELGDVTYSDLKFVTFDYTTQGILLLADTFFLGFPYGLKNYNIGSNRGKPIVKKGIISGDAYDSNGNSIGFILDGHNNPGFSGGPVITKGQDNLWKIFGVISSYIPQQEILYDKDGRKRMIIQENSGLVNCHSIDLIVNQLR